MILTWRTHMASPKALFNSHVVLCIVYCISVFLEYFSCGQHVNFNEEVNYQSNLVFKCFNIVFISSTIFSIAESQK